MVLLIFYTLKDKDGTERWLLTTLISFILLNLLNFNLIVLANIVLLFLLHHENEKPALKYLAFLLTAFAFYVKAYVAIVAGTIVFSYLVISFFNKTHIYKILQDCLVLLILFLV